MTDPVEPIDRLRRWMFYALAVFVFGCVSLWFGVMSWFGALLVTASAIVLIAAGAATVYPR